VVPAISVCPSHRQDASIQSTLLPGSRVIYTLQKTRCYKVISIDNYHNSVMVGCLFGHEVVTFREMLLCVCTKKIFIVLYLCISVRRFELYLCKSFPISYEDTMANNASRKTIKGCQSNTYHPNHEPYRQC